VKMEQGVLQAVTDALPFSSIHISFSGHWSFCGHCPEKQENWKLRRRWTNNYITYRIALLSLFFLTFFFQ
jgi:hypothetical protein